MSEDRFTSPHPKKPPSRPPQRNFLINLTLQVLRGLIDQLEGIVTQLENPSSSENSRNPKPKKRSLRYQLSRILSPIRRILPDSINRILPDSILAITIGFIVVILSSQMIQQFSSDKPPLKITETIPSKTTPSETIIDQPLEDTPPELPQSISQLEETLPESPQLDQSEPSLSEIVTENPTILEDQESLSKDQNESMLESENLPENPNKIPQFIVAIASPQPVNLISPPALELTSKQYLMTTIQAQMKKSTTKISPEIIVSVRANFSASLLRVELNENWYELSENKQNKMSQVLFEQAQNFDFTRIELIETSGKPLARSAVIGSNIVILNRTKSAT
ncbi:hypothetical protein [Lyngbya sp. PCC 8106]|uniref:hypothetical protein n=1 Tax=Lyngbya sp. (strain PCC 8106) TaxID=313612 RepID=UPI0000EAA1C7|nr:hypothetical protein [Lyngbya sp. PCC 8106]EAW37785.1 hypothetical protein L8106_17517 [Lyngbya sp. PCC 8106]